MSNYTIGEPRPQPSPTLLATHAWQLQQQQQAARQWPVVANSNQARNGRLLGVAQ